jgi:hypothetical protein
MGKGSEGRGIYRREGSRWMRFVGGRCVGLGGLMFDVM